MEGKSSLFILPEDYTERNFDKLLKHVHQNGDISYFAEQNKTYSKGNAERLTYIVDTRDINGEQVMTGYLEIRFSLTSENAYFKGKPFVGFTRTVEGFTGEGLGRRRLLTANSYVLSVYGAPLNSDTLISDVAERVWERLVADGLAESYQEGPYTRYRFIS